MKLIRKKAKENDIVGDTLQDDVEKSVCSQERKECMLGTCQRCDSKMKFKQQQYITLPHKPIEDPVTAKSHKI